LIWYPWAYSITLTLGADFWFLAISLLLNLEAAQQGRSMLFSDDQKLMFEGGKKGFVKNTKLDFMRHQLNLE
jgi:hypothetical protein